MRAATKSSLGLLVAVIVAGGLGLYAYFGVMKPEEREAEQKTVDERLVSVSGPKQEDGGTPTPEFTRLSVTANGETTELERRGEGWWLTSPVAAPADAAVVSQLLRQLESGKVTDALEPNPSPEDLARYGLQPPKFSIRATVHTQDAGTGQELLVEGGIENPFDGSVFLRKGSPTVYSAPGVLRHALAKSTFELRDKQVLSLPAAEVSSLAVKWKGGGYTLVQEDGAWRLTAPRTAAADRDEVTTLLSALGGERATAFPAPTPERLLDFEKPAVDVTVTLTAGAPLRLRLSETGGTLFALREQEGTPPVLAQVNPSAASHLTKTFEALRDRTVLHFEREAVARIQVSGAGEPLELVKAAADAGASPGWRLTRPEQGAAQAWKISSLLWALSGLKGGQTRVENPKNLRPYGLDKPSRKVELFGADDTPLATLTLGGEVKGDPLRVYGQNGAGTVFDLERSRLGDLPGSASELLEKQADSSDAGISAALPE